MAPFFYAYSTGALKMHLPGMVLFLAGSRGKRVCRYGNLVKRVGIKLINTPDYLPKFHLA
ncbi:MAG: hypothetical protein V4722_12750 [Bacteroidota bacterium]